MNIKKRPNKHQNDPQLLSIQEFHEYIQGYHLKSDTCTYHKSFTFLCLNEDSRLRDNEHISLTYCFWRFEDGAWFQGKYQAREKTKCRLFWLLGKNFPWGPLWKKGGQIGKKNHQKKSPERTHLHGENTGAQNRGL